ncbi:androgen-dependent TFPI-regulating protein isoform X1 [Papilio machaon]|uniref:androgen-dependent TFPI-regulating protein isoform X1 n=1 Tax=Papilio machaon TaxID=76193 RepID=UPI001E664B0D|nr:androgen-dependent TFPI-regulating protein isoform X1 [Papilio machaon]
MEDLWRDSNILYNILCFLITENEKLFDRSDARLYWKTVLHIFSILHHVYVSLFAIKMESKLKNSEDLEIQSLYTYRVAYLTGWNFAFQTLFLLLSLVHDVLEWLDKQDCRMAARLRYWRDIIFSGLVVPFTLFVSSMFWCVYAVDRELVFPRAYDDVVPWWFNHCVHTNISVVVLIETLLQARRRPRDFKTEIIAVTVVDVAYAIVYYAIYYFTHRWLYKVFGVMTWWQVCLYQLLIWGSSYLFYFLQFPVNRLIHGDVEETDNAATGQVTEQVMNGTKEMNEDKTDTDSKPSSLSKNSWSLKYRSNGSKIENSHL